MVARKRTRDLTNSTQTRAIHYKLDEESSSAVTEYIVDPTKKAQIYTVDPDTVDYVIEETEKQLSALKTSLLIVNQLSSIVDNVIVQLKTK